MRAQMVKTHTAYQITDDLISHYLYTRCRPPPIGSSGLAANCASATFVWQAAYSEYIHADLRPAFDLKPAGSIIDYPPPPRRFGLTTRKSRRD